MANSYIPVIPTDDTYKLAYPSDDMPLPNGGGSAGMAEKWSRADHVHPGSDNDFFVVDKDNKTLTFNSEETFQMFLGAVKAITIGMWGAEWENFFHFHPGNYTLKDGNGKLIMYYNTNPEDVNILKLRLNDKDVLTFTENALTFIINMNDGRTLNPFSSGINDYENGNGELNFLDVRMGEMPAIQGNLISLKSGSKWGFMNYLDEFGNPFMTSGGGNKRFYDVTNIYYKEQYASIGDVDRLFVNGGAGDLLVFDFRQPLSAGVYVSVEDMSYGQKIDIILKNSTNTPINIVGFTSSSSSAPHYLTRGVNNFLTIDDYSVQQYTIIRTSIGFVVS